MPPAGGSTGRERHLDGRVSRGCGAHVHPENPTSPQRCQPYVAVGHSLVCAISQQSGSSISSFPWQGPSRYASHTSIMPCHASQHGSSFSREAQEASVASDHDLRDVTHLPERSGPWPVSPAENGCGPAPPIGPNRVLPNPHSLGASEAALLIMSVHRPCLLRAQCNQIDVDCECWMSS